VIWWGERFDNRDEYEAWCDYMYDRWKDDMILSTTPKKKEFKEEDTILSKKFIDNYCKL